MVLNSYFTWGDKVFSKAIDDPKKVQVQNMKILLSKLVRLFQDSKNHIDYHHCTWLSPRNLEEAPIAHFRHRT